MAYSELLWKPFLGYQVWSWTALRRGDFILRLQKFFLFFYFCHVFTFCNVFLFLLERGTSHGPVSVCVCVCSQVGVLLKRLNVGSHKQHHTLRDSSFLKPKISAKFDWGHPLRGHQMQVWWVKIGDFRQITGYNSKMVKDRHIVSIKVE